jgi:hypothetical protein
MRYDNMGLEKGDVGEIYPGGLRGFLKVRAPFIAPSAKVPVSRSKGAFVGRMAYAYDPPVERDVLLGVVLEEKVEIGIPVGPAQEFTEFH